MWCVHARALRPHPGRTAGLISYRVPCCQDLLRREFYTWAEFELAAFLAFELQMRLT